MFGDGLRDAASTAPAAWIAPSLVGAPGTVGSLVPNRYESVVRVAAPPPREGWWDDYRDLFVAICAVGVRHTSTAVRAWYSVWEGHGYDRVTSRIAHRDPLDEVARRALDEELARLAEADRRRNAAIRSALDELTSFELPDRVHYLLEGAVTAVDGFSYPGVDGWRNPDLMWPDDRSWFVATDVDVWSLFVAGTSAFTAEVAESIPTSASRADPADALPIED